MSTRFLASQPDRASIDAALSLKALPSLCMPETINVMGSVFCLANEASRHTDVPRGRDSWRHSLTEPRLMQIIVSEGTAIPVHAWDCKVPYMPFGFHA